FRPTWHRLAPVRAGRYSPRVPRPTFPSRTGAKPGGPGGGPAAQHAWGAYGRSSVQDDDSREADAAGQTLPQRFSRAYPAAEADRFPGLRLRRHVIGGLRARGDLPGAVGRGDLRVSVRAVGGTRGRVRDGGGRGQLPAERAR